jgi:hypothetical protein
MLAVACVAMLLSSGCAYMGKRGRDLADIIDIGVTTSSEPQFALYAGFLDLITVGYADVEGTLWGLGSRNVGAVQAVHKGGGLVLWGYEQIGHAPSDATATEFPKPYRVGVAALGDGIALACADGKDVSLPKPPQVMNCPKFLHLGWFGIAIDCKPGELVDFLLGWTTLDLSGDDAE